MRTRLAAKTPPPTIFDAIDEIGRTIRTLQDSYLEADGAIRDPDVCASIRALRHARKLLLDQPIDIVPRTHLSPSAPSAPLRNSV